jgi:hypothetical protein
MSKKNFYLIMCVQTVTTDGVIPCIALPEKYLKIIKDDMKLIVKWNWTKRKFIGKCFDLCVDVQSESTQVDRAAYVRYVGVIPFGATENSKKKKRKAALESVSKDASDLCEFEEEYRSLFFGCGVLVACFHLLLSPFCDLRRSPPPRSNVNLIIQLALILITRLKSCV